MKKILLSLFYLFSILLMANAQSKESVYNSMATELCAEIKAKESELKNSEDIQMDIGLMMMPIFMKYESELKKADPKFKMTEQSQIEALGFEIGKRLVTCPEFMKLASIQKQIVEQVKSDRAASTLEGTLVSVTPGEFTYLNIRSGSGKTEKVWWMEYVPGDEKLKDGSLINKGVKVKYIEKEIYNATLKDYVKVKIATEIE